MHNRARFGKRKGGPAGRYRVPLTHQELDRAAVLLPPSSGEHVFEESVDAVGADLVAAQRRRGDDGGSSKQADPEDEE